MPPCTVLWLPLHRASALAAAAAAVVLHGRLLYGRGITADELVSYLAARPHPAIASRSPVVPEVRPCGVWPWGVWLWGVRAPYTDTRVAGFVMTVLGVPHCGEWIPRAQGVVWTTDNAHGPGCIAVARPAFGSLQ